MRLLIVDDEIQIRTGLAEGLDWTEFGFEEILTGANGLEALELCEKFKPEIIITDIRMPGIDGLELSKKVVGMYKPLKIIILSGYSEFEYAREALKIGVFDYLLKPINIEELQTKVKLAIEVMEKAKIESIKKEEYNKTISQKYIEKFLKEGNDTGETLKLMEEYCNINSKDDCAIYILSVDEATEEELNLTINYILTNISILTSSKCVYLFREGRNFVFLYSSFFKDDFDNKMNKILRDMNENLCSELKSTVSISVGSFVPLEKCYISYKKAKKALKHRLYLGEKSYIKWENLTDLQENKALLEIQSPIIKEYILSFRYEMLESYFRDLFDELKDSKTISTNIPKSICFELKNILFKVISEKGINIQNTLTEEENNFFSDLEYVTLEGYLNWIYILYGKIFQKTYPLVIKNCNREVMQAADYIAQNYDKDINLGVVAEHMGKSKNYFSSLFKKQFGVSFVEYLNKVRIREAIKLLETTDLMTYEISERVGFSDYKYFSSVFKKITDKSPTQYRKS